MTLTYTAMTLLALTASPQSVIPPPAPPVPIPHVDMTDAAKAGATLAALNAILTAQQAPTQTVFTIPSLMCQLLTVPMEPQAYDCQFATVDGGGNATNVQVQDSGTSTLAQTLFNALQDDGASYLDDPHYFRTMLANLTVSGSAAHFDDKSKWTAPPSPNVAVSGSTADGILSVLGAAGIQDDDRSLFVICTKFTEMTCSYQLHQQPGAAFTAEQTAALWSALKAAAVQAGYQPLNGTLEQMTVINAGNFTDDGTTLAFVMTADDATPPPAPPAP